jgi:hypothetical protein
MRTIVLGAAAIVALARQHAGAQKPPAIHALGRTEQMSSHVLSSVSHDDDGEERCRL